MNGHNLDFDDHYPVITDWDDLSNCPFARKYWVNPSNVNQEKDYEKGDFLRVYCDCKWYNKDVGKMANKNVVNPTSLFSINPTF